MTPSYIEGSVHSAKAASTAHVIFIVCKFVPTEHINSGAEHIMDFRQPVEILALGALAAHSTREMNAKKRSRHAISEGIARIPSDIHTMWRRLA